MGYTFIFILSSFRIPVYEVKGGSYTDERIPEILLDPDIDQSNACHYQPVGDTRSSTFVVDLESLQHPKNIKKDDGNIVDLISYMGPCKHQREATVWTNTFNDVGKFYGNLTSIVVDWPSRCAMCLCNRRI